MAFEGESKVTVCFDLVILVFLFKSFFLRETGSGKTHWRIVTGLLCLSLGLGGVKRGVRGGGIC